MPPHLTTNWDKRQLYTYTITREMRKILHIKRALPKKLR